MAPSHGMLSHLRFHRSPSSPALDQQALASQQPQQQPPLAANGGALSADGRILPEAASSQPLVLPPIPKVTTTPIDLESQGSQDARPSPLDDPSSLQASRSSYNTMSGFIGGVAFRKHRRDASAPSPRGEASEDFSTIKGPRPTSTQPDPTVRPLSRILTSSKSTSLLNISAGQRNTSTTSLRPANARLSSDPTPPPPPPPSFPAKNVPAAEPKRGKKGLPFLKNHMSSLLMKRRANQSARDHLPLPLGGRADEPTYDPRIRGTRVHDFSAPRRKSSAPATHIPTTLSTTQLNNLTIDTRIHRGYGPTSPELQRGTSRHYSNASDSSGLDPRGASTSNAIVKSSSVSTVGTQSSLIEQVLPPKKSSSVHPVASHDGAPVSQHGSSRRAGLRDDAVDPASRASGSFRTSHSSRNMSLSSIPRHMKSTSSRFSFDMIGSANQEKLLEERHRQRELDKKAAAAGAPRDSMYDEYDDDGFDYDAMMEDDGLEERIPGINADYDEETYDDNIYSDPADPDDDQENFAGFVFQRSNPGSAAVRPSRAPGSVTEQDDALDQRAERPGHLDATPPESQPFFGSFEMEDREPLDQTYDEHTPKTAVHLEVPRPTHDLTTQTPKHQPAATSRGLTDDDLYFGGDIASFEGTFAEDLAAEPESDGVPFDESIFDDNDTDQFGRPLPGAFALAQSLRRAAHQQSTKRPSFMASKLSRQQGSLDPPGQVQSGVGGSPSLMTEKEAMATRPEKSSGEMEDEQERMRREKESIAGATTAPGDASPLVSPNPTSGSTGGVEAVYQAALAAAAQKAAASGKFERSKSPSYGEADDTSEILGDLDPPVGYDYPDASEDFGYVDDGLGNDYELDDDAIIAEANASALANDADGWYGQEFGFYSAPINIHGSQSADVDYSYANGGFFGPKGLNGLDRSASGRVASREPNLTPITERSEYSNRNSLMSLSMPNGAAGTPTMQSPGLAQLAMMSDRGEDMTLSALMRLRSRAWGDSQASLVSSKEGSPRSELGGEAQSSPRASHFPGQPLAYTGAHGRKNSVFSVVSRDSDAASAPASPGLRLAIPALPSLPAENAGATGEVTRAPSSDPTSATGAAPAGLKDAPLIAAAQPQQQQRSDTPAGAPSPPVSRAPANPMEFTPDGSSPVMGFALRKHRRQKGSTDSISYTQEGDSGETRWVMERRRTGDCGQVEVVEREVVEGGRI